MGREIEGERIPLVRIFVFRAAAWVEIGTAGIPIYWTGVPLAR